MRNLNKLNKKSQSLIAAMAIMFIIAALAVTVASMLGVTSRGASDFLRSSQALGLAQAGMNWYMEQLAGTANWSTAVNQAGISLNSGTFDIALTNKASPQTDSATATRMDVTVTGNIPDTYSGLTIKRTMSQRAWKLPSASKFALFWGLRTGTTLTLSSTTINGDYWSIGSSTFSGSTMNGTAYRPTTETITGPASTVITFPYFSNFSGSTSTNSMPVITSTYYTNLITTYNGMITGSGTINQNANLVLTGNTITCQTFNTNTTANSNVTISGNGFIIANQNMTLNGSGTNSRTLTISPSGGNIVFLAGRNLTINSGAAGTHPVTMNSGASSQVRMYARSASSTAQLLQINNANTTINGALILANRRIVVQNGADLTNCTLFVNDAGSTTNNLLRVTGSGTIAGTLAGPCNLISIGRESGNPSALTIDASASVTGFLYQDDVNDSGLTRINTATIIGTLIANKFQGNAVTSSTISYDPTAIPDPPAEGFNGFAAKKPNSWSGN